MTADSRDMGLVPREPTEAMLNAAVDVDAFKLGDLSPLGIRYSPQELFRRAWSAMLSASPARGEGDAPPHGYLVKDFADGWFWTRDASLACADGAAVWSLQHGRYETSTAEHPMKLLVDQGWLDRRVENDPDLPCEATPSPGEGDAPVAWRWRFDADGEWSYGAGKPGKFRFGQPEEVEPLYTHPTPATPEGLREVLTDLHTIAGWLDGLASCPDLNDVAADGGVTVGMCYQQEAREFAGRFRRVLAALAREASDE